MIAMTVEFDAARTAYVPRLVAPTSALLQGTGVPAGVGGARRRGIARGTSFEPDSVMEALPL